MHRVPEGQKPYSGHGSACGLRLGFLRKASNPKPTFYYPKPTLNLPDTTSKHTLYSPQAHLESTPSTGILGFSQPLDRKRRQLEGGSLRIVGVPSVVAVLRVDVVPGSCRHSRVWARARLEVGSKLLRTARK